MKENERDIRMRLEAVLDDLRRENMLAEGCVACCNTCGHHAMAEMCMEYDGLGKTKDGYVFWHAQDDDNLKRHGVFNLRFGGTDELGNVLLSDAEVARCAIATLEKHGFATEWDGNPEVAITVYADPKKAHRIRFQDPKRNNLGKANLRVLKKKGGCDDGTGRMSELSQEAEGQE